MNSRLLGPWEALELHFFLNVSFHFLNFQFYPRCTHCRLGRGIVDTYIFQYCLQHKELSLLQMYTFHSFHSLQNNINYVFFVCRPTFKMISTCASWLILLLTDLIWHKFYIYLMV